LNRGLARLLFFFVFLIPVGWYLFLQLFGDNNFNLIVKDDLPDTCEISEISILLISDSLSISEKNYFMRVEYGAKERSIPIIASADSIYDCIKPTGESLVLINKQGIWGEYSLSREGVDQLLTELDILMLQENYGREASR